MLNVQRRTPRRRRLRSGSTSCPSKQRNAGDTACVTTGGSVGADPGLAQRVLHYRRHGIPRIHNLEVAGASVDLVLVRHEHDVGVNVLRRDGDVRIFVVQ
jgi:hypothetical protein